MARRLISAVLATAFLVTVGASAVFAGEVTGNGRSLHVEGGGKWGTGLHARSFCAFSGQEDLQWFTTDGDTTPVANPVKGVPAHSQNWGHVKQALGLTGGANSVPAIDWGCNGHEFGLK